MQKPEVLKSFDILPIEFMKRCVECQKTTEMFSSLSYLINVPGRILTTIFSSAGLPPSGKIRENIFLLESQGKSGNFNIFCRESGKVRENGLASKGEPNFVPDF